MEPAKDPRRDSRHELGDILREAEIARLRGKLDEEHVGDREVPTHIPDLKLVPGGAADTGEPSGRGRISYDAEEFRLVEPGEPKPRGIRIPLRVLVAGVLVAAAAFLWVRFPAGPPMFDVPPPPDAYVEASGHYALWLTVQRVDRYRLDHGALPASLSEVGGHSDLIGYERLSFERYRVTVPGPSGPIRFESADPRPTLSSATRDALRGAARR